MSLTVRFENRSLLVEIEKQKTVADLKKVLATNHKIDSVDIKLGDQVLDPMITLAKAGVKPQGELTAEKNLNLGPANVGSADPGAQAQSNSASVNCIDSSGRSEQINFDWMNDTVAMVKKIYSERRGLDMEKVTFRFKNNIMENSKTMKECEVALTGENKIMVEVN